MRKLSVFILSLALLAGGVVLNAQTTETKEKPKTETKAEKKEVKEVKKEVKEVKKDAHKTHGAKEAKKEENKPAATPSK